MHQTIRTIAAGMHFDGFYLLRSAAVRTSKTGKDYLDGTLADRTGSIDFKVWDYSGTVRPDDVGKIIKVRADAKEYQGTIQLTVTQLRPAVPTDPYDIADLIPKAPIDENEAVLQVREFLAGMKDPDYRNLCETMLDRHLSDFKRIPAAKSVHHGFLCGLLMHTVYMMRAAAFYGDLYAEIIDRDLLVAGTFLHDLAKREEFLFSEFGMVTEYSVKGQLLGHLVMGAEDIAETGKEYGVPEEKLLLLRHMILSHHGKPEFGAAVVPMTAEAELLFHLDLIDSRMEIYRETYENMMPGTFSEKLFALEHRIYKRS